MSARRVLPWKAVGGAALVLLAAAALLRGLGGPRPPAAVRATLSLAEVVGGADTAGYEIALEPRPFRFPEDHDAHPGFRTEWWYLTGNLQSETGERFGWQLTFFRSALTPRLAKRASAWATRQAWMAHFALTDVAAGRFHAFERFARGANGLAGASAQPFHVWLDAWHMSRDTARGAAVRFTDAALASSLPLRVQAAEADVAIDLELYDGKPLVVHGRAGLSPKGPAPGNASYYYSFPRLATRGSVRARGREFRVQGESWLDREWSTTGLPDGVSGWDWFALQLSDSTEFMFYRMRRSDGSTTAYSAGTFVAANGRAEALAASDVAIEVLAEWPSPLDGARYPARWRVRLPRRSLTVEVAPVLADQELNVSVRYWEGAVSVRGSAGDRAVRGRGYVELTGYAGGSRPGTAPLQPMR